RPAQPNPPKPAQGSPAPRPAREAQTSAGAKKNESDPTWPELLSDLKLSGMARALAEHCELVAREATRVDLRIAQAHQHLLGTQYQDRLRAALEERFGSPLRLIITLADTAGAAPAA